MDGTLSFDHDRRRLVFQQMAPGPVIANRDDDVVPERLGEWVLVRDGDREVSIRTGLASVWADGTLETEEERLREWYVTANP